MKRVYDFNAAKQLSAFIVLNPSREYVAKIQCHHSDGATVVNVYDFNGKGLQEAKASGWGYDRTTAALDGLDVDGIRFYDHCATTDESKQALAEYHEWAKDHNNDAEYASHCVFLDSFKDKGIEFANWDRENNRFSSAFMSPGFKGLERRGYTVIQAL